MTDHSRDNSSSSGGIRRRGSSNEHDVAIRAIDSINYVGADDAGAVVIASSHGGLYSAGKAVMAGVRGLIVNDAGVGLNSAGIAALAFGERHGLAVATIAHDSARIGDVADMQERGRVSHANAVARDLGIVPDQSCATAVTLMKTASPPPATLACLREHRHEERIVEGAEAVVCIDSASLIRPSDAGRLVVTGSHGGLIGGRRDKAINVDCTFAAFNDAGIGRDEAGIGRLDPLDERGIAAVTVAHMSAEIGDGRSTLRHGIISRTNALARHSGAEVGMPLLALLTAWLARGQDAG